LADNKYKLLVLDVDGTLIGRDGNILADDGYALTRAWRAGVRVSLSTGRTPLSCRWILYQLELDGYHIFLDGALVNNPFRNAELYARPLDGLLVRQAVEFARANDVYLELYSAAHYFVEKETWATELRREFFGLEPTVVDFTDLWERERIIKGQLLTSSEEEIARVDGFCRRFQDSFHFSLGKVPAYPGVDFINIVAPGVSKGAALETLVSHLGISMGEVMAVGDGANDLSFLSSVGLAVAMGNASDEVKAVADYVTHDVDDGGLAVAVAKFLL